MRSTRCGVLLLLSLVPASGGGEEKPRRTSFTDTDLETYSSRRARERRPAPDPTLAPLPAAPPPLPAVPPEKLEPAHVVIEDLNGTLRPEDLEEAEEIGDRILDFYHGGLSGSVRVSARYFTRLEDFQAEVRRAYGRDVGLAGFCSGSDVYIGPGYGGKRVLVHEVNHALVGRVVRSAPAWLNEGLSEFFEEASVDPAGLRIRLPGARQRYLQDWRNNGGRPTLQQILNTSSAAMVPHEDDDTWRIRALSWSLVDFLTSTEDGRALLLKYLDEINTRRTGGDPYTAMVMAYSGSIQQFEADWLKHVDRRLSGK